MCAGFSTIKKQRHFRLFLPDGRALRTLAGLLRTAHELNCIFITRDSDYGRLVFLHRFDAGVIYLRMRPATQDDVHAELARVLNKYAFNNLRNAFVVVEPGGHRYRRLPESTT